jgi:ABC-type enterochelin transport system substrate-binding protein
MIRDSNKIKYNLFFFSLDDANTKNKEMDAKTEKLKRTQEKDSEHLLILATHGNYVAAH